MPLVTKAELQATLNIGTLYADAVLDQVISSAEDTVLALLQRYEARAEAVSAPTTGTLEIDTPRPHDFYVGQALTLAGFTPTAFNGAAVVTKVEEKTLTVTRAHAQTAFDDKRPLIPAGNIYDTAQRNRYDTVPEVKEAALAIAVDIFQSRVAPGGQMQGIDFTPGPYRLGRSLFNRVSGLLARWTDTGTLVG
jgi:hypothetical protein